MKTSSQFFQQHKRKFLITAWFLIFFHTIKDIFQDLLETDFLYFLDANENLIALPEWGRWLLAFANTSAVFIGLILLFLIPIALKKVHFIKLNRVVSFLIIFFWLIIFIDIALDSRIRNPKLFFDKSTRKPASQAKQEYLEILKQTSF